MTDLNHALFNNKTKKYEQYDNAWIIGLHSTTKTRQMLLNDLYLR